MVMLEVYTTMTAYASGVRGCGKTHRFLNQITTPKNDAIEPFLVTLLSAEWNQLVVEMEAWRSIGVTGPTKN